MELPAEARIHPVFHCSLLRHYHGAPPSATEPWPLEIIGHKPLQRPLCILDNKLDTSTSLPTQLVLTQWAGQPPEDTSWESWPELQEAYHLEDKVVSGGGGIVSTHNTHAASDEDERRPPAVATTRPTRAITKPSYLRDYIS